jgi:hypothetical protein
LLKSEENVGNNSWQLGAIAGYEFHNFKEKTVFGGMFGILKGNQHMSGVPQDWLRFNGFNIGAYGSKEFLENYRIEGLATWVKQFVEKQRFGTSPTTGDFLAKSSYDQTTTVGDLQISYKFIIDSNWSIRPNLGNTYINSTTGSLTLALATKTAAATFVPSTATTLTITSLLGAADMTVTGASSTAIVILSALLPAGAGNYTVAEGVLRLARATTTGSGALEIQSGGILDCATNSVLLAGDLPSGTLTLRAGGILQVGAGTFAKAIVLG